MFIIKIIKFTILDIKIDIENKYANKLQVAKMRQYVNKKKIISILSIY